MSDVCVLALVRRCRAEPISGYANDRVAWVQTITGDFVQALVAVHVGLQCMNCMDHEDLAAVDEEQLCVNALVANARIQLQRIVSGEAKLDPQVSLSELSDLLYKLWDMATRVLPIGAVRSRMHVLYYGSGLTRGWWWVH